MLKPGAALLFDIDGTLADTDAFHLIAVNRVFAPWGHTFDHARYVREIQGFTMDDITQRLMPGETPARRRQVGEEKEAIFRALARSEIRPLNGLLDLLGHAERARIPIAAVTNAPRVNAAMILEGLEIADRFPVVVCGEELPHGKPHPLPYLEGLKALGADPDLSLAFEDSRSGVRAAAAAGIATIGITTGLSHAELIAAGAVDSAPDFAAPQVARWVRERIGISV